MGLELLNIGFGLISRYEHDLFDLCFCIQDLLPRMTVNLSEELSVQVLTS